MGITKKELEAEVRRLGALLEAEQIHSSNIVLDLRISKDDITRMERTLASFYETRNPNFKPVMLECQAREPWDTVELMGEKAVRKVMCARIRNQLFEKLAENLPVVTVHDKTTRDIIMRATMIIMVDRGEGK